PRLAFQTHGFFQVIPIGCWTVSQRTAAEDLSLPQPELFLALHHKAKDIGLIAMYAQRSAPVIPQKQIQLGLRGHSCNFIQALEKLPEAAEESPSQLALEIVHQHGQLSGCPGALQPRMVALERNVLRLWKPAIQIQHDPPPSDDQFQIVPGLAQAPASGHYPTKDFSGRHDGHRKRRPEDGRSAVPICLGELAPENLSR